jgi:hypothetical protein
MEAAKSLREALVPLLTHRHVRMTTIALGGEIITLDALLDDYDKGVKSRLKDDDQWDAYFDTYHDLLLRVQSAVSEFLIVKNDTPLTKALLEVKEQLSKFC